MLSGPGLGQGSGKVFGNIGGPVTLKIHCGRSRKIPHHQQGTKRASHQKQASTKGILVHF